MALLDTTQVGILGAGAMGSGIAQVAATAGHRVVIVDSYAPSLEKARAGLQKALAREVEKGRLMPDKARDIEHRIRYEPGNGEDLYTKLVEQELGPAMDVVDAGCGHGRMC